LWLSVDPLAVYNPMFEDEFYFDGQHNGGVFNSGNLSNYIYCYKNPIKYVDPNGKQNVAGVLIGAVVGGGLELGTQLLSGKSLDEVDWADVGIESAKGAIIGFNPALAGVAETAAIGLKASVDVSKEDGIKVVGGRGKYNKSLSAAAYDGAVDFVGGKARGYFGKKLGNMAEASVKKSIKAETKAVKQLVKANNKFNKVTDGGRKTGVKALIAKQTVDAAKGTATAARKKTVKAQMVKTAVKGPVGTMANGAVRNMVTDKAKQELEIK